MDVFDLGVEAVNTHRDRPLVSFCLFLMFRIPNMWSVFCKTVHPALCHVFVHSMESETSVFCVNQRHVKSYSLE